MLETSLLSIRIKVLICHDIYFFVFVLWHYTQQEDFFDELLNVYIVQHLQRMFEKSYEIDINKSQ